MPKRSGAEECTLNQRQQDAEAGSVRALRVASLHERVLLVEAGPGWGKTTAVRGAFPDAHYLETPAGERAGALHLELLRALGYSAIDAGAIVARLEQDAHGVARSIAAAVAGMHVVVDDVQRLDPAGCLLIETLVESQGVALTLVGRSMAGFPIGSWLARGLIGMPFGPDTLALGEPAVRSALGRHAPKELVETIAAHFGGWPIAASLAASMLRRGYDASKIGAQLQRGIATVTGAALLELPSGERERLLQSALAGAYGVALTGETVTAIRRLGFPESASGLHEMAIDAILASATKPARAAAARALEVGRIEPAPAFALLAGEAPDVLPERIWELLVALYDRYDRATLERVAAHPATPSLAVDAARAFVLMIASSYGEASHIAERIVERIATHSQAVALRLLRCLIYAGRAQAAAPLLETLDSNDPQIAVRRECMLANIHADRARLAVALDLARAGGDPWLIAFANVHAALVEARSGNADRAEGLATHAEESARAAGSVTLQVHALKIAYAIAMLRANLDLAAVQAGRLVTLHALVSDPEDRASDLVAAFEVEVYAGRTGRAAAYDDAIKKLGHGWLGMETYVVCRAIADAWENLPLSACDRLAAFATAASPEFRRLPNALAAYLAAAGDSIERAHELLDRLDARFPASADPLVLAHFEMASSFAAMANLKIGRNAAAAQLLKIQPRTPFGGVFVEAARRYAGSQSIAGYAEAMRAAGFNGIAMMAEACEGGVRAAALSRAEFSVLSYLASGMDAPHIAEVTGRSLHTIKNQRRSMLGKLGAGNTLEAVAIARRLGLL